MLHPSWYRGKEVTAEDLNSLESYLLGRSALEGTDYGVEFLDLQVSLDAELEGSLFRLTVNDLAGVTDLGHPVRILSPLQAEVRVGEPPFEFDAEISVNPNGPDLFSELSDDPPKFTLRLNSSHGGLVYVGGTLDLGAYRYSPEDGLTCLARPRVRRLNAIRPLDSSWEQWTQPVRSALEQRLLALRGTPIGATWRGVAWTSELGRLALQWPVLTISQLHQSIVYLRQLSESDPAGVLTPLTTLASIPTDCEGDDLPRYLAEQLGLRLKPAGLEPVAAVSNEGAPPPQPDVKLKWLPPDTLLARFANSLDGKKVAICIPMSSRPPECLEVRGGPAVGGFRVKEDLTGEARGPNMVYGLKATPREGETFRFQPVDKDTADGVYVTW